MDSAGCCWTVWKAQADDLIKTLHVQRMYKEYMSSRKSKLGFLSFDNTYMAYVRPQI